MNNIRSITWLLPLLLLGGSVCAELQEDQVLVLYNSQNASSLAVYNYYSSIYSGVLGFDLNDPSLSAGTISYSNFTSQIRDPIRTHLADNDLAEQVVCLVTTKGLPHRIQDTDSPNIGDSPTGQSSEFGAGDATSASVDSELSLLWQNLTATEAGGSMDSPADNLIANPYYGVSSSLTDYSRTDIASTDRAWLNNGGEDQVWIMLDELEGGGFAMSSPGNFYYTARLDANSVEDVQAMIDRSQNIVYDRNSALIVFDENASSNYDGEDYENAAAYLVDNDIWSEDMVVSDETSGRFYIGAVGSVSDGNAYRVFDDVAMLVSYGGNHSTSSQDGYVLTYNGQLVDGAIWNSMESYNGRPLAGLPEFDDQGHVEEWIAIGGTFAFGNVWEPFAGTVAQNRYLVPNWFDNDLAWIEAAWSSLPFVSWQQIVIGDPLARAIIVPEPMSVALLLFGGLCLMNRRSSAS